MRIFLLLPLLVLSLAVNAWAAAPASSPASPPAAAQPAPADTAKAQPDAAKAPDDASKNEAKVTLGKGTNENEYISPYYLVTLPEGWKAVMPPHDQQGNISAIFATNTNTAVVTMIIGPNDGADAQTIASMFAEQFKATGKPSERNGQYTFKFQMQNGSAQAWVATQGPMFMVTAVSGNTRQGQDFLRRAVKSDQWSGLLPK